MDIIRGAINQKGVVVSIPDYMDFITNLVKSLGFYVIEDRFTSKPDTLAFFWRCQAEVDDYIQYRVEFNNNFTGMKPVKMKREGITQSLQRADVNISFKGVFITDWFGPGRWESRPITKFLKSLYDMIFMKPLLDERKAALRNKVMLMENEIKSFFNLPRFV